MGLADIHYGKINNHPHGRRETLGTESPVEEVIGSG